MGSVKFWITLILVIVVSFTAGKQVILLFSNISGYFGGSHNATALYIDQGYSFPDGMSPHHASTISWQSLLPVYETGSEDALALEGFSNLAFKNPEEFNLDTFSGYSDAQYQSFIESIDTNPGHLGKLVRIPGYIVPIALAEDRFIKGFFLVPYFGACVHFPPPPANQMIYVEVANDFPLPNVYNAYMVEGVLRSDVFEDPRGTSAYFMDLYRVTEYDGEPDDVRDHSGQP